LKLSLKKKSKKAIQSKRSKRKELRKSRKKKLKQTKLKSDKKPVPLAITTPDSKTKNKLKATPSRMQKSKKIFLPSKQVWKNKFEKTTEQAAKKTLPIKIPESKPPRAISAFSISNEKPKKKLNLAIAQQSISAESKPKSEKKVEKSNRKVLRSAPKPPKVIAKKPNHRRRENNDQPLDKRRTPVNREQQSRKRKRSSKAEKSQRGVQERRKTPYRTRNFVRKQNGLPSLKKRYKIIPRVRKNLQPKPKPEAKKEISIREVLDKLKCCENESCKCGDVWKSFFRVVHDDIGRAQVNQNLSSEIVYLPKDQGSKFQGTRKSRRYLENFKKSSTYTTNGLKYLDKQKRIPNLLMRLNHWLPNSKYSERGWIDEDRFEMVDLGDDYPCKELRGQQGVRCKKNIGPDNLVGEMIGSFLTGEELYNYKEKNLDAVSRWVVDVRGGSSIFNRLLIDSHDNTARTSDNSCNKINDKRNHGRGYWENCEFRAVIHNGILRVIVMTTRSVKAGMPLLIDYGRNYWSGFQDVQGEEVRMRRHLKNCLLTLTDMSTDCHLVDGEF